VEVYTSRAMRVHVAERLVVDPEDELLAERYLESRLPQWARDLFLPENLADIKTVRLRSAEAELYRRLSAGLVRELADLRATSAEPIHAEVAR